MLSPLMKGHEDDGMFHEKVGSTIARLSERLSDRSLERR